MTTVTAEKTHELRERIREELEGREPEMLEVAIAIVVDDETGDESTAVDLTLADPPKGADTWDLEQLDQLALEIERIIAAEDLPPAVISVIPVSREEFEDAPS